MMWTVAVTIMATLVVVVLVINFHTPEKKIQHQVRHLYGVVDPQFEREMGTLLGPAILADNEITPLQNGDEIFPAMLKAIRAAQVTINFETLARHALSDRGTGCRAVPSSIPRQLD
jgi:cardiolipin synthase A/B